MSTQATRIPSPMEAFMRAFADSPEAEKMSKAISSAAMNIGGALAAAGVTFGNGGMANVSSLGALALDPNLPNEAKGGETRSLG